MLDLFPFLLINLGLCNVKSVNMCSLSPLKGIFKNCYAVKRYKALFIPLIVGSKDKLNASCASWVTLLKERGMCADCYTHVIHMLHPVILSIIES